jgi:hypothetical protein
MDNMTFTTEEIQEGRLRVTITDGINELGVLYFEKAKKSFQRKPIGMDAWTCVDAKVDNLYIHLGADILPKDIVERSYKSIKEAGF